MSRTIGAIRAVHSIASECVQSRSETTVKVYTEGGRLFRERVSEYFATVRSVRF